MGLMAKGSTHSFAFQFSISGSLGKTFNFRASKSGLVDSIVKSMTVSLEIHTYTLVQGLPDSRNLWYQQGITLDVDGG